MRWNHSKPRQLGVAILGIWLKPVDHFLPFLVLFFLLLVVVFFAAGRGVA
jgi:hypothetical protein